MAEFYSVQNVRPNRASQITTATHSVKYFSCMILDIAPVVKVVL